MAHNSSKTPAPREENGQLIEQFGYKPKETKSILGGVQHIFEFPNGYGASVVCHTGSYGGSEGFWEMAVQKGGHLCYDTPITDDVLGWLEPSEVKKQLKAISKLEKVAPQIVEV